MNFKKTIVQAVILASAMLAASSQASVAHLTLTGTPGDYITRGKSIDNIYSSDDPLLDANFVNFRNIGTAIAPATNYVGFFFTRAWQSGDNQYAALDFSTHRLGGPLVAGVTYTNAERAPFASLGHPGLSVSYGHRGCNKLTGSFTVDKLSFHAGALDTFSASFTQSCDGGAAMQGAFYYNARLTALPPADVPEPGTLALLGLGIAGLGFASRRQAK